MMIRSRYDQPSLLARLWLRIGAFLGKTLLWLLGLGLLGWLAATALYAWQHSGHGFAELRYQRFLGNTGVFNHVMHHQKTQWFLMFGWLDLYQTEERI